MTRRTRIALILVLGGLVIAAVLFVPRLCACAP